MPFGTVTLNDGNKFPIIAFGTGSSMIYKIVYYQTETYVGLAIKESGLPRSSLYITTKYSFCLNKIGLSYVDMSIGVSNFTLDNLQKLLKTAVTKPAVNQVTLLEYCAKQGITVQAYGSLNSITQNPGGPVDAVVDAAARRIGATSNQVIFSWVRSKGVAIVTYLAVEDLRIPLTAEEIAAIDAAGAKGPPSRLVVARIPMQHRFGRFSLLVMWLTIAIVFGFATFFML
ncbi:NADP-dependent oxidoreductase domain-containing protein [Suillus spraguei]|nr:NADP-dependent oxidoreductase domain-containing protein [Suillus spraguei]